MRYNVTAYEGDKPKTLVELFSLPGTWGQHRYVDVKPTVKLTTEMTLDFDWKQCRFCLGGGINFVYGGNPSQSSRAAHRIYNKLYKHLRRPSIAHYNDRPERTQEDILQLVKDVEI